MAKKKTEKESPFVPVEERPYRVPENWCWTYVNEIALLLNGYAFKSSKYAESGARIIRIANVQNGYIEDKKPVYYPLNEISNYQSYLLCEKDLLMSLTGNVGRIAILPDSFLPAVLNQRVVCLREKNDVILKQYVYYYFLREEFIQDCIKNSKGTAQLNMSTEWLKSYHVPLAPLAEQQRIVDRIKSLFAKLDEAKGKVQDALEGFEERRSAILKSAFSGKLTESWRKEHGKSFGWKIVRFDEVAYIRSNLVEPSEFKKMPHIAPDNIEKKTGKLLEYHTIEEDGVTSGKHHFYPGQILYSKIRPYLSKVVLVDFEGLCSADMYPIEAIGNVKLLWYQMLSDDFLVQASTAGSRSVLPKINQKELSALKVNVTSDKEEETEIVRILDDFFAKEAEAREKVESTLDAVENIKKSILAKAFRGELGTNNPEDESAEELLKRTLA